MNPTGPASVAVCHASEDVTLRLLIVDEDRAARDALTQLCQAVGGVRVVAEAATGADAIDAAERVHPTALLIDEELPDMSGFDVLSAVHLKAAPLAIMLGTQTDPVAAGLRAVRAFEVGAIDYLLKPVEAARFAESMERARRYRGSGTELGASLDLLEMSGDAVTLDVPGVAPRVLVGEREHRLYVLKPEQIDYIEAHGNYVKFNAGSARYRSRDTVKHLSTVLTGAGFVRISRSLLVNIQAILYVQRVGRGTYAFILACGTCLYSGAAYRDEIRRAIPLDQAPSFRSARVVMDA